MSPASLRHGFLPWLRALAGLTGSVIEVGAGNGLNFAHYPPGVTRVLAVEPAPYLRGVAAQQAAPKPVTQLR